MNSFQIKTKVAFGTNSLQVLKEIKNKNVWIICDRFLADGEGFQGLIGQLDTSNNVHIFTDVVPDPPISKVAGGVSEAGKIQPQVMIAFGGGSAIDTAKGIYYFAKRLEKINISTFIAIPTTSGTGSEVTAATVITDPTTKIKYPLFLDELIPDMAILDAQLVVTVPPAITANTGMDVLTHAIEAYVSKDASDYTDALGEKSVQLTLRFLTSCYDDGRNLANREKMHNASTMAGMAFNCANLGLNHSIAHQLGAQFHVPHGLANAILLDAVIRFNAFKNRETEQKYAEMARICGIASRSDSNETAVRLLRERIVAMMEHMQMPRTLTDAGVAKEKVYAKMDEIATNALKDACLPTSPTTPSHQELKEILEQII
ncbi:1-propanol dehydrogenase PduQ [Listeria monocytogenes]